MKVFLISLFISLSFAYVILGHLGEKDEKEVYCDMLALYEEDTLREVPEDDKRGWPNFKNLSC